MFHFPLILTLPFVPLSLYSFVIPYSPISFLIVFTNADLPLSIKRDFPYAFAPSLTFVPVSLSFHSFFSLPRALV
jgi:hypothetical protein